MNTVKTASLPCGEVGEQTHTIVVAVCCSATLHFWPLKAKPLASLLLRTCMRYVWLFFARTLQRQSGNLYGWRRRSISRLAEL